MELRVGDEEVACLYYIFYKVKNRIQWRKQVIQSDQDVHVCGISLDGTRTPFCTTLLFWDMDYLSFSFLFFHASGHGYFFLFRIAHIIFAI